MALAERGSGLASSGLAHQHGRDELGHGTHGFGFYKAGVHGFRFYRTSDLTRCENWPPDRISRSWLPLTVARAGSDNQLEAYDKLREILVMEADDEDVYNKAVQCMERVPSSKKVGGFVITRAHVEHLLTVQPGQTKAANSNDFMANFCTRAFWNSKVPEDMLPVIEHLYGWESGCWDIDDTDGIAYGISTYHFNMYMYIAGF